MAKRRNNLLLVGLLALVAVLIVAVVIKNKDKGKGEKVITEEVGVRVIKETVTASGKIFPRTEVKISSDVSGEIVELYVAEGDSVVQGQLLAKIDPDAYQSQVERGMAGVNTAKAQESNAKSQIESARAQREQIQAQLTNAQDIHKRNTQLRKDGVISQADFETSQANLRVLEANLRSADATIKAAQETARGARFSIESAEASLKELRTSLRRTTIYAPISGIVSRLPVLKGERVLGTIQMQGTEIMRIADLNDMEVRVEVSENDIPRVSLGDVTEISVDAYIGRKFKGRVTQLANSSTTAAAVTTSLTSDQVTNFEVRISIDPASYSDLVAGGKKYPFRPGMSASVSVNTKVMEDALSVPIQAVTIREKDKDKAQSEKMTGKEVEKTDDDFLEVVFVTEADTVRMVEVQTGIQDATYIQILSGLKAKDQVVSGPYTAISRKLKSGMKIQKVSEEEFYESGEDK